MLQVGIISKSEHSSEGPLTILGFAQYASTDVAEITDYETSY